MAIGPKLQGQLRLQQALLPGVQLGLQVLRMPLVDLDKQLRDTAETNPFLRYAPPAIGLGGIDQSTLSTEPGLADHLREQLLMMGLPSPVRQLAEALIGDLTDEGYLASTDAELAKALSVSQADIRRAIKALQSCEPVGIAARSLDDCLARQLTALGFSPELAAKITANLERLVEHRWTKLKHILQMNETQLTNLAKLIRTLSPAPAAQIGDASPVPLPELIVEPDEKGGYRVLLQADNLATVSLDADLLAQVDRAHPQMAPLRQNALSLTRALAFRRDTLLAVASAIVMKQQAFFNRGDDHMRPLTRNNLAQTVGLHPTTIGRAVAGKALSFEGRVVPLSAFLTSAVGQGHSAFSIQSRIRGLITAESSASVLSDEQIAALLRREGVDIARRTVAKYRECMSIPSSYERMRRTAFRRNGFS